MNPDAKQKWVAALRSGEFKQGTCHLQPAIDRYCCLGVACIVAEREGVEVKRCGGGLYGGRLHHNQASTEAWLGLTANQQIRLSDRNDSGRWPFERIADYIEKGIK